MPDRGAAPPDRIRLGQLPAEMRGPLREIAGLAAERGERAYLVGGVVRDLLLERPVHDLDLVVEGDGPALARAFARRRQGELREHPRFGTASVTIRQDRPPLRIDLATARKERYAHPGALPETGPAALERDLARRDFSINAMAVPLHGSGAWRVVDPFDGRGALAARRIRALHPASYRDDATRIFRAVRFAARLRFQPAAADRRRIRDALAAGALDPISGARVRTELEKIYGDRHPARAVAGLERLGALAALLPDHRYIPPAHRPQRRLERLGPALASWKLSLTAAGIGLLALGWKRAGRAAFGRRAGLRAEQREAAATALERSSRLLRYLEGESASRAGSLHARCRAESDMTVLLALLRADTRIAATRAQRYLETLRHARPAVRGSDLIRAGVPAGPWIARALAAGLRARLDGRAPDDAAEAAHALAVARRLARRT
ncbi:hypothetical protein ABI59_03290 [Acidobacteria bacterium Mor1]|nr:hypothetical protein ABI59_03290 [Acidobacteria bacterium Mor1]